MESDQLWIWLYVAGAVGLFVFLLVLPFGLLPIVIKLTQKLRAIPNVYPFDPNVDYLPPEVAQFFGMAVQQLTACGFQVVQHAYLPDQLPNLKVVTVVLVNEKTGDAAMAAVIHTSADIVKITEKHIEFYSEFQDGTEISTTNAKQETAFSPVPHKRQVQLDDLQDLDLLFRIHCCAVAESKAPKKPLPAKHEWLQSIAKGVTKEMNDQLPVGTLTLQSSGEFYVPTWSGAYRMTWKLLQPIKALRRASRRRRNEELLRNWGLRG